MRRVFAVLVLVFGLSAPMTAFGQVDAGRPDAAPADAAPADAAPPAFNPALDDEDGCDCATAGGSGAGLAMLVGAVAFGLRRRR